MASEPTYNELFEFLLSLGFERSSTTTFEHSFRHDKSGVFLVFSMLDDGNTDRPVRDADLLSTRVHLQESGLIEQWPQELERAADQTGRIAE